MLKLKIILFGTTEDGKEVLQNHDTDKLKDVEGIESYNESVKHLNKFLNKRTIDLD